MNEYIFHTQSWTEGKKTINSGVYVKRVAEGGEDDFHGVIIHLYMSCHILIVTWCCFMVTSLIPLLDRQELINDVTLLTFKLT